MIKVNLKNQEYTIEWEYYNNKIDHLGRYDEKSNRYSTTCTISVNEGVKVSAGISSNDSRDAHVKEIARRRSLQNALKWSFKVYFSKEDRKEIWKTYFNRKKENKIRTDKKIKKSKKIDETLTK